MVRGSYGGYGGFLFALRNLPVSEFVIHLSLAEERSERAGPQRRASSGPLERQRLKPMTG